MTQSQGLKPARAPGLQLRPSRDRRVGTAIRFRSPGAILFSWPLALSRKPPGPGQGGFLPSSPAGLRTAVSPTLGATPGPGRRSRGPTPAPAAGPRRGSSVRKLRETLRGQLSAQEPHTQPTGFVRSCEGAQLPSDRGRGRGGEGGAERAAGALPFIPGPQLGRVVTKDVLLTGCSSEVQAGLRRPLRGLHSALLLSDQTRRPRAWARPPPPLGKFQVRRRSPDGDSGWGARASPGETGREPRALVPGGVGVGRAGGTLRLAAGQFTKKLCSCRSRRCLPQDNPARRGPGASPAPAGAPPARGQRGGRLAGAPQAPRRARRREAETGSAPGGSRGGGGPRGGHL